MNSIHDEIEAYSCADESIRLVIRSEWLTRAWGESEAKGFILELFLSGNLDPIPSLWASPTLRSALPSVIHEVLKDASNSNRLVETSQALPCTLTEEESHAALSYALGAEDDPCLLILIDKSAKPDADIFLKLAARINSTGRSFYRNAIRSFVPHVNWKSFMGVNPVYNWRDIVEKALANNDAALLSICSVILTEEQKSVVVQWTLSNAAIRLLARNVELGQASLDLAPPLLLREYLTDRI